MRKYTLRAKAQSLAEYALILALVAILCIVALKFLSSSISSSLEGTGSAMR